MKKICLFLVLGFFSTLPVFAQQSERPVEDSDIIFFKPEVEAEFPGGLKAFKEFLEKNLRTETPARHNAPVGTYTVIVRFVVNRYGNISGVVPETHLGYGLEDEVVRVIKLSRKWTPAMQNGVTVSAYHRQPVTFVVTN